VDNEREKKEPERKRGVEREGGGTWAKSGRKGTCAQFRFQIWGVETSSPNYYYCYYYFAGWYAVRSITTRQMMVVQFTP